jgi:mannose-6-phosphate isomerase-like protein (cupin superfamily)
MKSAEHDLRTIVTDDLFKTIEDLELAGYQLLMIKPADTPRAALLILAGEKVQVTKSDVVETAGPELARAPASEWSIGRAGMMYRDLVPDRLGGKLIASHIRIVDGGPVNDQVHFHRIDFQIIYCLKGAIEVVYEDQGDPIWLRPGDCVLQPPEIRHRVLEAEAGSEVIEITSPAEHETWFDQELNLPTESTNSERSFSGQRFNRHQAVSDCWVFNGRTGLYESITSIGHAGDRAPIVTTLRAGGNIGDKVESSNVDGIFVHVLIDGLGLELTRPTDC